MIFCQAEHNGQHKSSTPTARANKTYRDLGIPHRPLERLLLALALRVLRPAVLVPALLRIERTPPRPGPGPGTGRRAACAARARRALLLLLLLLALGISALGRTADSQAPQMRGHSLHQQEGEVCFRYVRVWV